jgi:hypothetical protein
MKQFITMQKIEGYNRYRSLQAGDHRFVGLWFLFDPLWEPQELIKWLLNDKRSITCTDWICVQKENGKIALYDVSATMDETYTGEYLVPEKRFEISRDNFEEILTKWEELRVSRPDTILLVIHEDNHVSLETDPVIIKQYQDAGYAFDIDKQ